jgi:hypothetical protein
VANCGKAALLFTIANWDNCILAHVKHRDQKDRVAMALKKINWLNLQIPQAQTAVSFISFVLFVSFVYYGVVRTLTGWYEVRSWQPF